MCVWPRERLIDLGHEFARVFETLEITSPPLHLRRQIAATLLDSTRGVNDVLDVGVRALADLIGVRINFPNPRENEIGPARKSRSERWPGSRVEFPDVSRRVAREGFVAKVLDESFIPVRAPGYDCLALFTKFLVRDVHITEIIPEWRLFTQCSKRRVLLVLELLLVRDPTLLKLSLFAEIFT